MWDLTENLPLAGVPCDMLCAILPKDGADPSHAAFARQTKEALVLELPGGGRVFCVKALAKKAATMLSPAMVRWLRRHATEYDLIHVHHPDPMAALALRLSGYKGKVVLHWHSDILSQKLLMQFYRPLQSWLVRRACKIVGTTPVYVAQSPWLQKWQEKCTFVPIGIAPVQKADASLVRGRYPCQRLILSIGRLVPYKGYRYLVEAAALLPEGWKVVIGGMGPLREELLAQIHALGLEGKVELAGYLPQEEIPAWFAACDAFVLCSVMKTEAFGIVQLEAFSCGKPVVATKIPESGVSWVNADGVSGRNVEPGSARELAEAILEVVKGQETLGRGARERFEALFTVETMIEQIKQIYEKV